MNFLSCRLITIYKANSYINILKNSNPSTMFNYKNHVDVEPFMSIEGILSGFRSRPYPLKNIKGLKHNKTMFCKITDNDEIRCMLYCLMMHPVDYDINANKLWKHFEGSVYARDWYNLHNNQY